MDLPKPGNIPQYDLLRVTAMLLIVFCHCLLIPSEAFDTYDAINVVMPSCKVANCMSYVFDMIATCVLPMFMFLSGALLYKGFTEKGRGEFKSFFKKKWSRLMIPFFWCLVYTLFQSSYFFGMNIARLRYPCVPSLEDFSFMGEVHICGLLLHCSGLP